jgi:nucleotide-binding universal stress UspA family protein
MPDGKRSARVRASAAPAVGARPLQLFATLWSLRGYPTPAREWAWARKFAAIRAAGFDGVFSPPIPELARVADLPYIAATSIREARQANEVFAAAARHRARLVNVQLGTPADSCAAAVRLARAVRTAARKHGVPFVIETHRATFTETPERALALARAYRRATGEMLPGCVDHSHFAVVRHVAADALWTALREPAALLDAAQLFHLRPFNGHHIQLPALDADSCRTPEYLQWLAYVRALLASERARPTSAPLRIVVEIGHDSPSYRLSGFGDTWRDVQVVAADLRRLWAEGAPA